MLFFFLSRAVPICLLTKFLGTLYKHCYLRPFMVDVSITILIRFALFLLAGHVLMIFVGCLAAFDGIVTHLLCPVTVH